MRIIRFCLLAGVFFLATNTWAQDDSQPVDRRQYASREVLADPTAAPCPEPRHTLTQVNGNLYRHAAGAESGFVLITSEGALVIDTHKTCTALWLKDEINNRFHVPVKYMIVSHAHFDHVAGSQVFQQAGATVIAHKNALEPIIGNKYPSAVPDRIFDKQMTITLGGETAVLYRIAPSHSNSMIQIYFPKYKALFCADVCQGGTLPFQDLHDMYYDGWIETLEWVLKQDIDIIDTGHRPATKAQQQALRDYMTNLHAQILSIIRRGLTWEEVFRNVTFTDEVRNLSNFNTNYTMNMLGMWRWVYAHHRALY